MSKTLNDSTLHVMCIEEPVRYADGIRLLDGLLADRLADRCPDTVLVLEHRPVITMGCSGSDAHLLLSEEELAAKSIEFHRSSRGGDVTYHAPGQLIVYPVLKLSGDDRDVHRYVTNLEEIALRIAGDFGVNAYRRDGFPGAWTESGKLAAIGVRFRRWVSSHGMSFNVNIDLDGFSAIVPCGLSGETVTSLRALLGDASPDLSAARDSMVRHLGDIFERVTDVVGYETTEQVPSAG